MLKRPITYTDFDDNEVTETFYFNLMKSEIVKLELGHDGGLDGWIKKVSKTQDNEAIYEEFKRIVLLSYGEKSEDGKRFIKSPEAREAFSQTAAFDSLLIEMMSNQDVLVTFVKGIMPKDMQEAIAQADKTALLTPPNIQPAENLRSQQGSEWGLGVQGPVGPQTTPGGFDHGAGPQGPSTAFVPQVAPPGVTLVPRSDAGMEG